jgi:SHS2 domain-containing protein
MRAQDKQSTLKASDLRFLSESMKRYEYLENEATADLAVRSYGSNLQEAFANMALGMFNAITPLEGIERRVEKVFSVRG